MNWAREATASRGLSVEHHDLHRRLSLLLLGRVLVTGILIAGALSIHQASSGSWVGFTPVMLVALALTTLVVSALFAMWMRTAQDLVRVAIVQIVWDLLLCSALLYATGSAASGFSFVYGITILMAALVLGPGYVLIFTFAAVLLYVGLALLTTLNLLPIPPDQPPNRYAGDLREVVVPILLNGFTLLLVAMLARNLATRLHRAGGELRQAVMEAADLTRLNTDIVRSLTSGLITAGQNGRVRSINPAGLDIFRCDLMQVVGTPVQHLLPGADRPASRNSPPLRRVQETARRPEGSTFPVGFTQTNLIDASGETSGTLVVFQDLSELAALKDVAKRAEQLAALGRMAAGLAHEVRNPLGSISGSVQLVRESATLDAQESKLLGIVLREVDRLDALVSTMLRMGRSTPLERREVDMAALASEVVEMAHQEQTAQLNVRVALDAPEQPVYATVDPDQIRQVIWNLVKNALQFSPAGGTVRVRLGHEEALLLLSVEDQGPGIPADEQPMLFEMFYSRRSAGSGLGLALVQRIVEAHRGTVRIDPSHDTGARFLVHLPIQSDERIDSDGLQTLS